MKCKSVLLRTSFFTSFWYKVLPPVGAQVQNLSRPGLLNTYGVVKRAWLPSWKQLGIYPSIKPWISPFPRPILTARVGLHFQTLIYRTIGSFENSRLPSKTQTVTPFGCCSTVRVDSLAHRKWKETKQQPRTAGPGNMLGCCLISFHFLWGKLSTLTVHVHVIISCRKVQLWPKYTLLP